MYALTGSLFYLFFFVCLMPFPILRFALFCLSGCFRIYSGPGGIIATEFLFFSDTLDI